MLTPEDMSRIEEEEQKRHAEEQYRAQIRDRLQQSSKIQARVTTPPPTKDRSFLKMLAIVAASLLSVALISSIVSHVSASKGESGHSALSSLPSPQPRYMPMTTKIASGQVVVRRGGYVYYKITITSEMREPVVRGSFSASGGTGNDVMAVIAQEDEYTNWINGHEARVYWGTHGKETTGTFEVHLNPGIYYLAISNRFSAFSDKYVFLNADLSYKQLQGN